MLKLFEPGIIGKLSLKNRIVMAPINVGLSSPIEKSWLTQRGIDFYVARAKGGVGLIMPTFMSPSKKLEPSIGEPVLDSRLCISWLSDLAEAVHDYGAKICVQLCPGFGRNLTPNPALPHGGTIAPSPLPNVKDPSVIARELTIEEIEQLIKDYEFSTKIIKDAGVDAIEIHAHQGYLTDEFMTTLWNKRTDKYGGALDDRLRFPLELIEAIRRAAGANFPILFRYPITHYLDGGRDIEEGLEIARRLETAGVNALDVNAGCYETYNLAQPPTTQPRGCWVELAKMTKEVVNIPVIVAGKLGYPELAERVLQEGKADFIALGRYLLADPEWPNKVKEGRTEDIIPCIGCHEACIKRRRELKHTGCAVNPATGRERELTLTLAEKKKSVLVIGGGPGGMEAARVTALRGHEVTLWEKGNALGGNLIPAAVPDFKDDYKLLIDYLITQIKKLGVKVELRKEAIPELILKVKPEVVLIATGAKPIVPEIKGIEKAISAVDLLLGKGEAGESVVVVGGGRIGCETALYLAQQGKKVTIVEILDRVLRDMVEGWGNAPNPNAIDLLRLLAESHMKISTSTNVLEITDTGLVIADAQGKRSTLEADTITFAVGMKPNTELQEALQDKLPEVYAIGDCVEPRLVLNAIWEGFRTARLI